MEVINPSGNTVLIDFKMKRRLIENGDWPLFKLRQVPTIGTGPENKVCLLIQDNGLGDHMHAMPAIKGLVDAGKDVTLYVPKFYAPLFARLGVEVRDSDEIGIGFIEENKPCYGTIYSLSAWCIIHDEETEGDVSIDRFEQFAMLVGATLPATFDWWDALFGVVNISPLESNTSRKSNGHIGIALQSSSVRRSYPPMVDVAMEAAQRWKNPICLFGGGPNAKAKDGMFEAKTLQELIWRIQECSFIIAVDNGILAVALALGIPVLAIFGPTDEQTIIWQFARYVDMDNVRVLASQKKDKSCERPCSFQGRGFGIEGKCNSNGNNTFVDCLKEISIEQIVEAAQELYDSITD